MTAIQSLKAIDGMLSFLAIWLFICGPLQWVCIDWDRQRMFASRDRLFDLALEGRLEFGSREYEAIRSSMNHMIRFAHGLTFRRFLLVRRIYRDTWSAQSPVVRDFAHNIVDDATRAEVLELIDKVQHTAVGMMLVRAPALLIATLAAILPGFISKKVSAYFRSRVEEVGDIIQWEANSLKL